MWKWFCTQLFITDGGRNRGLGEREEGKRVIQEMDAFISAEFRLVMPVHWFQQKIKWLPAKCYFSVTRSFDSTENRHTSLHFCASFSWFQLNVFSCQSQASHIKSLADFLSKQAHRRSLYATCLMQNDGVTKCQISSKLNRGGGPNWS